MRTFFILFILLTGFVHADEELPIRSVTGGLISSSSNSKLMTSDDDDILEFRPNVATSYGLMAETKYIGIGYIFSGNQAEEKNWEKSKFFDLRVNFTWKAFDVRLNYQSYRGALVKDNGKTEFYRDYEVKAKNARMHYYFTPEHLKYIREGRELIQRASSNEGYTVSKSLFLGLSIDERNISLPDNLITEHQQRITRSGINYDRSFSALSFGPLVGGDIMLFYGSGYLRGKLGAGSGFQRSGPTGVLMEIGFNIGYAFSKKHLVSIGTDLYSITLRNKAEKISNSNFQSLFAYTYAFTD